MANCIYSTGPAIGAALKESNEAFKKKYVYDYYNVKYQPGSNPTIQAKSQYPQLVKVVFSPQFGTPYKQYIHPLDTEHSLPTHTHNPEAPTIEVHKKAPRGFLSTTFDLRRYSVIYVTSMTGNVFLPNKVILDNN